jgi:predicted extracellular nuclease
MDSGQVTDLKLGDKVDVSGQVQYFSGPNNSPFKDVTVIQLSGGTITKKGTGTPPAPTAITEDIIKNKDEAKKYEGMLVELEDIKVTQGSDQYGQFEVTGGLQIDDDLYQHSPTVGDCVTVRGVLLYFYAYRINPRSSDDVPASANCKAAAAVKISEIQDPQATNRPAEGDEVKVTGVVTALDESPSSSGLRTGFWIQESGTGGPYKGIYVFHKWSDTDAVKPPAVGNEVEVVGTYTEFNGLSELKDVTAITDNGAGTAIDPITVPAADIAKGAANQEQYEGVLIKVENIKVKELDKDKAGTKVYGFIVDGVDFEVKNDLFAFADPAPGDTYASIVGVLHAFKDTIQLLPRQASDLTK